MYVVEMGSPKPRTTLCWVRSSNTFEDETCYEHASDEDEFYTSDPELAVRYTDDDLEPGEKGHEKQRPDLGFLIAAVSKFSYVHSSRNHNAFLIPFASHSFLLRAAFAQHLPPSGASAKSQKIQAGSDRRGGGGDLELYKQPYPYSYFLFLNLLGFVLDDSIPLQLYNLNP